MSQIVSNHRFIDEVKEAVHSGYGMVPFIGSGISAPSGILMGMQFGEYLAWTVFRCVSGKDLDAAPESPDQKDQSAKSYWNLEAKGWPPTPKATDIDKAKEWIKKEYVRLCNKYGATLIIEDNSNSSNSEVQQIAVDSFEKMGGNKVVRFGFSGAGNQSINFTNPHDLNRSLRRPLIPDVLTSFFKNPNELDKPIREFWQTVNKGEHVRQHHPAQMESSTSEDFLVESAVRSLADWTSALDFLARLKWPDSDRARRPLFGDRNPSIIDRFNTHITQGKKPNLAHQMLCHLSIPARIRVILTTNFDRLMEDAFEELNIPYRMLPVSQHGALPAPDTVHSQHCIIKLHGDCSETRADFSLNEEPTAEDKRRFAHFIAGYDTSPGAPPPSERPPFAPSYLLVCGFSGRDARCVQMMKYYLDTCPWGRIYWICHSDDKARSLFSEVFSEVEYFGRIKCTTTQRADLLFNDMYQKLTLSLSQGGFSYQFFPNVPPEPVPADAFQEVAGVMSEPKPATDVQKEVPRGDEAHRALGDALKKLADGFSDESANKYAVYTQKSGVLATLREIARDPGKLKCRDSVWLELEDYLGPKHIAHEVLLLLALRLGNYQLDHIALAPLWNEDRPDNKFKDWCAAWASHCKLLFQQWNRDGKEWLLILYGRNGTGGCSGWTNKHWNPNSGAGVSKAQDEKVAEQSDTGAAQNLPVFLSALAATGLKVVFAPFDERRKKRDVDKQDSIETHARGRPAPDDNYCSEKIFDKERPDNSPIQFNLCSEGDCFLVNVDIHGGEARGFESIISQVDRRWVRGLAQETIDRYDSADATERKTRVEELCRNVVEDQRRRLFLYSCLLMRQARQYSAMFSQALMPCEERYNAAGFDNDWQRTIKLSSYLKELVGQKFFLLKPGGFWWTYRDLRLGARELLERGGSIPQEHLEKIRVWSADDGDSGKRIASLKGYKWIHHARARSHFYIGDWYARVFHTTSHAQPFFEALHHFTQSALHARFARGQVDLSPGAAGETKYDETKYCFHLFQQALHRIIKALRIGQDTIQFWCQEALAKQWFGVLRKDGKETGGVQVGDGGVIENGGAYICRILEEELKSLVGKCFNSLQEQQGGSAAGDKMSELREKAGICESLITRLRSEFELISQIIKDGPRHSWVPPMYRDRVEDLQTDKDDGWRRLVAGFRNTERLETSNKFGKELLESVLSEIDRKLNSTEAVRRPGSSGEIERSYGALCEFCESGLPADLNDWIPEKIVKWVDDSERGIQIFEMQMKFFHSRMTFPDRTNAAKVEVLGEFIYALVRRAKLAQHAVETDDFTRPNCGPGGHMAPYLQSREAVILWIQVSALSNLLLEARSLISPDEYVVEFRLRLRTLMNYGLALGRLGRFFEAHRRLNEATALLAQRSGFRDYQEHTRLLLRRAEVSLLEARHIRWLQSEHWRFIRLKEGDDKPPCSYRRARGQWMSHYLGLEPGSGKPASEEWETHLRDYNPRLTGLYNKFCDDKSNEIEKKVVWRLERLRIARLDDAWSYVERSERLMRGRSQSKLWWSRLHALQLRIIGEHNYGHCSKGDCDIAFSSMAFRERYDARDRVRDCFKRGVAAAARDVYRYVRLLHYLIDAMRTAIAIEIYPRRFEAAQKDELFHLVFESVDAVKDTWVHAELCKVHYAVFRYTWDSETFFGNNSRLTQYAFNTLKQLFRITSYGRSGLEIKALFDSVLIDAERARVIAIAVEELSRSGINISSSKVAAEQSPRAGRWTVRFEDKKEPSACESSYLIQVEIDTGKAVFMRSGQSF